MSENHSSWSEDRNANQALPTGRVAAPAAFLIVVACLACMANVAVLVTLNAMRPKQEPTRPPGMDDATYQAYERGRATAPLFDCCLLGVPTLGVYAVVLAGGIQMSRLCNRRLAVTASILAMLPCSPAFLFGLPIGIWALIVLLDPAVKAGFDRNRGRS